MGGRALPRSLPLPLGDDNASFARPRSRGRCARHTSSSGGVCGRKTCCRCQSPPFIKVAPRAVYNGTGWFPFRRVFAASRRPDGWARVFSHRKQVDESPSASPYARPCLDSAACGFEAVRRDAYTRHDLPRCCFDRGVRVLCQLSLSLSSSLD